MNASFVLRKVNETTVTNETYQLLYAAYYGDVSMMKKLKLIEWNVNAIDLAGRTALHVAAS